MSASVLTLVIMGAALWAAVLRPSLTIGEGALLFYNGPVGMIRGDETIIGHVNPEGEVVVTVVGSGEMRRSSVVHRYDGPDDHAAPALIEGVDGNLIVATSFHSSELYVYRLDPETLAPALICKLDGRFTYPRLARTTGGLRLLVRQEMSTDTPPEEQRGHLAIIDVSSAECSEPRIVIGARANEWIYATQPLNIGGSLWVAWSIYDARAQRHTGVYATKIEDKHATAPLTLVAPQASGPETMAWSIGFSGRTVAVSYVNFEDAFVCCWQGKQSVHIVALDGRILLEKPEENVPFYARGLWLHETPRYSAFLRHDRCPPFDEPGMTMPIPGGNSFLRLVLGENFTGKTLDSRISFCAEPAIPF